MKKLEFINMNANSLGIEGIKLIAEGLKHTNSLKKLSISIIIKILILLKILDENIYLML